MSGSMSSYGFRITADASQLEAEYARATASTSSFQSATEAFTASLNSAGRPVDAFTASLSRVSGDMGRSERATRSAAAAFSSLVAGLDPVEAAYQKAARAEAMMTDLQVRGIEVTDRQKRAVAGLRSDYESLAQAEVAAARAHEIASRGAGQVRTAHDSVGASIQRVGNSAGVTRQQLQQLTPQFNDLFVQIASGQGVLMPLIQQGPQITQIFGGLRATFAAVAASIGPVGIAAAAATVAVGGLMLAFNSQQGRLADLRTSLRALAGDYAALAPEIDKAADRVAKSGLGVSRADATTAMFRLRQGTPIGASFDYEALTRQAADFARVMNTDLPAAADRFARAMRDPAGLVKELQERNFPGMTDALRRTVEEMVAAGQRGEAFSLVLRTIGQQTGDAAKDVAPLTSSMRSLKEAWSDFTDVVGPWVETGGKALLDFFTGLARTVGVVASGISTVAGGLGNAAARSGSSTFGDAEMDDFERRLIQRESARRNEVNRYGYAGTYQMGTAALQAAGVYARAPGEDLSRNLFSGTFQIPGFPEVKNLGDFLENEGAQREAFRQHINKLNDILDELPGQDQFSRAGLLAVAHGYGPGAAREFVQAGGRSDRADGNGVRLDATYQRFAGQGASSAEGSAPAAAGGQVIEVTPPRSILAAQQYMDGRTTRSDTLRRTEASAGTLQAALADPTLDQNSEQAKRYREELVRLRAEIVSLQDPMDEQRRRGQQQAQLYAVQEGAARELARAEMEGREEARKAGRSDADQVIAGLERRREAEQRLAEQLNSSLQQQRQQTSVTQAAAREMLNGAAAAQEATIRRQAEIEALKYAADGTQAYRARVEELVRAKREQKQADADLGTATLIAQQRDQVELLQKEAELIGRTTEEREAELAVLRERQRVINQGGDPNSATSLTAQRNIRLVAQQKATNQQLENSWNDLARVGESTFERVGSAITEALVSGQGKAVTFGNVFKAVMADVAQSILRLAVLNPILNSVFGGSRGTLGGALQVMGGGGAGGAGGGQVLVKDAGNGITGYAQQGMQAYSMYDKFKGGLDMFSPSYNWNSNSIVGGFDSTFQTGVGNWLNTPTATSGIAMSPAASAAFGSTTTSAVEGAMMVNAPWANASAVAAEAGSAAASSQAVTGTIGGTLGGVAAGLGGAYSAYEGFKRGGIGGNIQGVGGTAMAGMGTYAAIAGSMTAVPVWGWIAAAALMVIGALLPGQKPSDRTGTYTFNTRTGEGTEGGLTGDRYSGENRAQAAEFSKAINNLATQVGKVAGLPGAVDVQYRVGVGARDGLQVAIGGYGAQGSMDEAGIEAVTRAVSAKFLQLAAEQTPDENVRKVINTSGTGDIDATMANLEWYNTTYKELNKTSAEVAASTNQFAEAMKALRAPFDEAIAKAEEFGLATETIAERQKEATDKLVKERDQTLQDIFTNISDRVLVATGGDTFDRQMQVYYRQQDAQRRSAAEQVRQLGAGENVVQDVLRAMVGAMKIEAEAMARQNEFASMSQRYDALSGLASQGGVLTSFLDRQALVGASPQQQFASAQQAYDAALAKAGRAGAQDADLGAVTSTASTLLEATSAFYGDGAQAALIRTGVTNQVRALGADLGLPGFTDKIDLSVERWVQSNTSATAAMDRLASRLERLEDELKVSRLVRQDDPAIFINDDLMRPRAA